MKRILIIGASGFLGQRLYQIFSFEAEVYGTYYRNSVVGFEQLDVRDLNQTSELIHRLSPDLVIHTAGISNVEVCERDRSEAYQTNVIGTQNVVKACLGLNTVLVYPSSVYVFDGEKKEPYSETDEPNPINYYGLTKLEAEEAIKTLPGFQILRSDLFYGYNGEHQRNGFLGQISGKKQIRTDVTNRRQPLFIDDVGNAIRRLYEIEYKGIVHLAGPERMNTYQLGRRIEAIFREKSSILVPVEGRSATGRPRNTTMDTRLARSLGIKFTPIELAIRDIEGRLQSKHPEGWIKEGVESVEY